MFFARVIAFLVLLGGLWILWLKIIKPLLEAHGIEVDEEVPEVIETDQTKQLEILKEKFEKLSISAQAAEEGLELTKKIKELEEKMKDIDAEKVRL